MQNEKTKSKMTEKEFKERFKGVICPTCRGAKYPRFRRYGINESKFEDCCRHKGFRIQFFEETQSVKVDWLTQESCFQHSAFDAELTRCFKVIGVTGGVHVSLRDRDGYHKFEYALLIER